MKNIWTFLALFLLPWILSGAPVPYAGKVAINGANFQGDAQFTFALRDANGTVRWRNGVDADSFINVPVDRGLYVVLLGGQGMNSIPNNLFLEHPELYLQVRFFRLDTGQWLHLQPDQRITSAPHALAAEVARNAFTADAVKPGAITKSMLASDVLADLNATVVLPEQNATIQTGSITRSMLAPNVLSDLNATVAPGSITRQMLSQAVLADLNRTITITRSMLPASVQADLNRSITRGDLPVDVLADLNRTITRNDLPPSVLADLNRTITKNQLGGDVLSDLNRTITRSDLPASVLSDLNRTITKSNLGSDVLNDLNSSISLNRLSPEVLAALGVLPSISTQPFARYDHNTGNAQIEATGRGYELSYQWLKDGQPINGATAPVLQIADADTDDNATYAVRITNSLGETTSQVVSLQDAIGAPGPPLEEANATEVPRNGLVLWLDAEDLNADGIADNLAEDVKVFNWADLSGDDRNFTQSDLNKAPTVKLVGNRQTLHFAQTAWMKNDENATVNTVFFALNVPAGLREVHAYLLKGNGWGGMFKGADSASFGQHNSEHFSNVSEIRTNGANLNGLLLFDQPSVVSAFRTTTAWTFQSLNIGYTWEGLFHEVIFYDRILSDSERSDVEDYLMDKWGVADLVPPEPEDGLLAYYKFEPNQSDKLILDSSGNGHHVELSGPLSATPLTVRGGRGRHRPPRRPRHLL